MVSKFLIAIGVIVAAMAALVLLPNLSAKQQEDLSIEYSRQNLTQKADGTLKAASADDLEINSDLSATYRSLVGAPVKKDFTVTGDEMNKLKGLIISTGFMQLPAAQYAQNDTASNFTRYSLKLTSGDNSKTFTWVNAEASDGPVPPILRNIGTQLDAIIKEHA